MRIDEAITHEKELAKEIYVEAMLCHANPDDEKLDGYVERGKYHEQIAEWLEELKDYQGKNKMVVHIDVKNMDSINDKIEELSKYAESQYNKAIDDFVKLAKEHHFKQGTKDITGCIIGIIEFFAEQLKAGGTE